MKAAELFINVFKQKSEGKEPNLNEEKFNLQTETRRIAHDKLIEIFGKINKDLMRGEMSIVSGKIIPNYDLYSLQEIMNGAKGKISAGKNMLPKDFELELGQIKRAFERVASDSGYSWEDFLESISTNI